MPYLLRNGLSCCEVDGRLVFLDLEEDRYFRLPDRLGEALAVTLQGKDDAGDATAALVARGVLVWSDTAPACPAQPLPLPTRSAVESRTRVVLRTRAVVEVMWLLSLTQFQLKSRQLSRLLASLVADRSRTTTGSGLAVAAGELDGMLAAAALFRQARAYVPIEPCCLLDSVALVRFLARRRLRAAITFGVTLDPFAAHCWVQAGDWVLNDTVGNAIAHNPIRSI